MDRDDLKKETRRRPSSPVEALLVLKALYVERGAEN
jgi:hypothetical protein